MAVRYAYLQFALLNFHICPGHDDSFIASTQHPIGSCRLQRLRMRIMGNGLRSPGIGPREIRAGKPGGIEAIVGRILKTSKGKSSTVSRSRACFFLCWQALQQQAHWVSWSSTQERTSELCSFRSITCGDTHCRRCSPPCQCCSFSLDAVIKVIRSGLGLT